MMKQCECKCGTEIEEFDSRGRSRHFVRGHGMRGRRLSSEHIAKSVAARRMNLLAKYPDGRTCVDCEVKQDWSQFINHKAKTRLRCRECQLAYDYTKHAKNKYGISAKVALQYRAQIVCEICGAYADRLDHDHSTGEVRGKLCHSCNAALGFMNDDPDRLLAAATYLLKSKNMLGAIR